MRRALAASLMLAAAMAGCGSESIQSGSAERTELEITVWPAGRDAGSSRSYTLACDPAEGTVPDPERACAVLAELGVEGFTPVPVDAVCTEIYGGPDQAWVRGTVDGETVDAQFSRQNGCEIARWDALRELLPTSSS